LAEPEDSVLPVATPSNWRDQDIYRGQCARAVRSLFGDHFIVIDTEPQGPRLYEIGMVRITNGWIEDVESLLVDPGPEVLPRRAANADKTAKAELVDGAGSFSDNAAHIHNFVAGHTLFTGWRPANDRDNFLGELKIAGLPFGPTSWVDVRSLFSAVGNKRVANMRLDQAYAAVFGREWKQKHYALDDAVHTAHLLAAVSLELVDNGLTAEDIETMKGRLGRSWTPVESISPPRRRHPLPPPVPSPPKVKESARRWLETHGSRRREELPCVGFSKAGRGTRDPEREALAEAQRLDWAERRANCGIDGPVALPVPMGLQVVPTRLKKQHGTDST